MPTIRKIVSGFKVGLSLDFGGLGGLEVTLGDGVMSVEILRARIVLCARAWTSVALM